MRASLKIIAYIYALLGAAAALGWLYAALVPIALLIAFAAWQWWVFRRPQVLDLYSSNEA